MQINDEIFMQQALELARKGEGYVSPNPLVGAVIVRGNKIIASGWHARFGGPHAEVQALCRLIKSKHRTVQQRDLTLYVNMEPCLHIDKKTPPCVPAILQSRIIRRVVVATKDPNPRVSGRGINELRKSGIEVKIGCMRREAEVLNEKFFTWMRMGRAFVGMKVAMTLDGKIATRTGHSKWITSQTSRRDVCKLRDSYDAILVGINTVLKDDPLLAGATREPMRIILDSRLRIPPSARVLRDKNVLIATTAHASIQKLHFLQAKGISLYVTKRIVKLASLLHILGKQNISSVLVEGGAEVFGSCVDEKVIDRVYWYIAPKIVGGGKALSAVGGKGSALLTTALSLVDVHIKKRDGDFLIEGKILP